MKVLTYVLIFVFLVPFMALYSTLSWGFVFFKFWNWFVLPVFSSLPVLTYVGATGLMFVVGLFQLNRSFPKETDKQMQVTGFFLNPWLTLLLAYLIKVLIF
jgi:hypothetical protein